MDFKKALDLLDDMAPPTGHGSLDEFLEEKEQLRLRIWALAVGRNDWSELDTSDPVEAIKDTVFFQLVDFCFMRGLDLDQVMPGVDQLLEHERLRDSNAGVKFLIQTGYEHIHSQLTASSAPDVVMTD